MTFQEVVVWRFNWAIANSLLMLLHWEEYEWSHVFQWWCMMHPNVLLIWLNDEIDNRRSSDDKTARIEARAHLQKGPHTITSTRFSSCRANSCGFVIRKNPPYRCHQKSAKIRKSVTNVRGPLEGLLHTNSFGFVDKLQFRPYHRSKIKESVASVHSSILCKIFYFIC